MVTDSANKRETLDAIARGLEEAPQLSEIGTYATTEMDWEGANNRSAFPVLELVIVSESDSGWTMTETVYDENNDPVGVIYERSRTLRIQISIHVLSGTARFPTGDHVSLGDDLDRALGAYLVDGYNKLFPDADGNGIDAIELRALEEGHSESGEVGGVKKYMWVQDAIVDATERIDTLEEWGPLPRVETFIAPGSEDFQGTGDGGVEAVAPHENSP